MLWIQSAVNWLFGISLGVNAMLFLPQIVRLLKKKNSDDVSLTTFFGFCVMQAIAILYGYFKPDMTLMIGYGVSLLTCGFSTILICFYRLKRR